MLRFMVFGPGYAFKLPGLGVDQGLTLKLPQLLHVANARCCNQANMTTMMTRRKETQVHPPPNTCPVPGAATRPATGPPLDMTRYGQSPLGNHTLELQQGDTAGTFLSRHQSTRVATANVNSLTSDHAISTAKTENLCRDLSEYGIHICGVSEARKLGSGLELIQVGGQTWEMLHSGHQLHHINGVAILSSPSARASRTSWKPYSDRLILARFAIPQGRHLTVIQCYAPTEQSTPEDTDIFYRELQEAIDDTPIRDELVLMGDFNAQVGTQHHDWKGTMGPWGFGRSNPSNNGERLLSFCLCNQLTITNTLFRHKPAHKATWYSPASAANPRSPPICTMIDYIITRRSSTTMFHDTRTYQGIQVSSNAYDHRLVASKIKLQLKHDRRRSKAEQRYNIPNLKDPLVADSFRLELQNKFECLTSEVSDVETEWEMFTHHVTTAATNTIGPQPKRKQPEWISSTSIHLATVKSNTYKAWRQSPDNSELKAQYRRANNDLKRSIKEDKNTWWKKVAKELNDSMEQRKTHEFYRTLKRITGTQSRHSERLKDAQGREINDTAKKLQRWVEYYRDLLNIPAHGPLHIPVPKVPPPGTTIKEDAPSLEEVRDAIQSLKNFKAAGVDTIPAELLKAGEDVIVRWVHRILCQVWISGKAPEDWKKALLVNIFKKGDPAVCGNFRGISKLSVPGKVYTLILLNRVSNAIDSQLLEHQSGFRRNRGCVDQIFTLRQLVNMAHEFNKPLHLCYIDLTKAYDSVNRDLLWRVLAIYGVPGKIIGLLQDLHCGTKASVCMYGDKSEWFDINSGVRQGCVIAPTLFNIFLDSCVRAVLEKCPELGVTVKYKVGSDWFNWGDARLRKLDCQFTIPLLMYADDMVLICEDARSLRRFIDLFEEHTQLWGLTISIKKTEIQVISPAGHNAHLLGVDSSGMSVRLDTFSSVGSDTPVVFRNEVMEFTDCFKYLGSKIDSSPNELDSEIRHRISRAADVFGKLDKVLWRDKTVKQYIKCLVYKQAVIPTLLYGSETWNTTQAHINKLEVFQMSCLRRIMGITRLDRRGNADILTNCKQTGVDSIVARNRLRWLGHVLRMPSDRIPHRILFGCIAGGSRGAGRPRLRWSDVVWESDLRGKLGMNVSVRRLTNFCSDRDAWRLRINELVTNT